MWVKNEKEGLQMSLKHFISLTNTKVNMENIYIIKFWWYGSYLMYSFYSQYIWNISYFQIVHKIEKYKNLVNK